MPICGYLLCLIRGIFNRLRALFNFPVAATLVTAVETDPLPGGADLAEPETVIAQAEDWWLVETPEVLPAVVAALGPRLRTGNVDSVHRITCAYTRGRQAAAIRRGEVGAFSGPRSELRTRYYVVLANGRGVEPYYTRDYRTYLEDVKPSGTFDVQSISHGFPSEAEVTAFVLGAGFRSLPQLR